MGEEPCSQTSCSLLRSDLIASGCFCSQRMMAKLSTSGCSGGRLYTWLRGVTTGLSPPVISLQGKEVNLICLSLSRNICGTAVSPCINLRQARLHKDAAPKTQGQTETDTQETRLNSVCVFFSLQSYSALPLIKFPSHCSMFVMSVSLGVARLLSSRQEDV